MSHRADGSFFCRKREWSKRKDLILGYYLKPYLPKVSTQKRPILIVDGFAGPGQFEDGSDGSPKIIERAVEEWKRTNRAFPVPAKCIFVDKSERHITSLRLLYDRRVGYECRNCEFDEAIPEIESHAKQSSTFLYLDPFTVEGLRWDALSRVFRLPREGRSVEVLLNFSSWSFVRRGLAALALNQPVTNEEQDWVDPSTPSIERLNQIVGGEWWQPILKSPALYPEKVSLLKDQVVAQLQSVFSEVCSHDIRANWRDEVPKYTLIFGSRHPDALMIMNNAVVKARESFESETREESAGALFELRSEEVVPDTAKLPDRILEVLKKPTPRNELVMDVARAYFGFYKDSAIRLAVKKLVASGKLYSADKTLNDTSIIMKP